MQNIDILTHFDESTEATGLRIYKLRESERADFFAKLPLPFRCLYLAQDALELRVKDFGTTNQEEIFDKIPDVAFMMSGEFAEILCYFLVPEKYLPDANLRPPKWKWKEAKNIPAHFTDVILFCQRDPNIAAANDSLISIEAKARASKPSSSESSLQKAIKDAEKDAVSRLGESLFHLKTKYKDDHNVEAVKKLERFADSVKYPETYQKHFKAIAVVDDAYAQTHIDNVDFSSLPTGIKDSFEVILIQIADLKSAYEDTYAKMLLT